MGPGLTQDACAARFRTVAGLSHKLPVTWLPRDSALPPPSWTRLRCRRPRDGRPGPQGSEGERGADSRAKADLFTVPFLTPLSPAQLSSPRSLPETRIQPSTLPLSESPFLKAPYPDPGPRVAPSQLLTSHPTPTYPFPPSADSRFNQSFSLGFFSRTQPGLSKSCRGAFQSPVSTLGPVPLPPADLVLRRNSRSFLSPSPSFPPAHHASRKQQRPALCPW